VTSLKVTVGFGSHRSLTVGGKKTGVPGHWIVELAAQTMLGAVVSTKALVVRQVVCKPSWAVVTRLRTNWTQFGEVTSTLVPVLEPTMLTGDPGVTMLHRNKLLVGSPVYTKFCCVLGQLAGGLTMREQSGTEKVWTQLLVQRLSA